MTLTFDRRGVVALVAGVVTGVLAVRWLERRAAELRYFGELCP